MLLPTFLRTQIFTIHHAEEKVWHIWPRTPKSRPSIEAEPLKTERQQLFRTESPNNELSAPVSHACFANALECLQLMTISQSRDGLLVARGSGGIVATPTDARLRRAHSERLQELQRSMYAHLPAIAKQTAADSVAIYDAPTQASATACTRRHKISSQAD